MSDKYIASEPGVQTTDGSATTVATYTPADGTAILIHASILGRNTDGSEGAGYILVGAFRRVGSTVYQIGSTTTVSSAEDDGTWNAAFSISGTDVNVQVTGAASTTINWTCHSHINEVQ